MDRHEREGDLMASLKVTGMDEVEKMFDDLMNVKSLAIKAVNKAAPILLDSAKKSVRAAANKGYATGGLENSFAATKAKNNQWGTFAEIKPVGKDNKGVRYGERAAYLEYGTVVNGSVHASSAPWRKQAVNKAKTKCEDTMEKVLRDEWKKIGG